MASGINIYSFFGYPKYLFWISRIIILDIQNKVGEILYFGYPE